MIIKTYLNSSLFTFGNNEPITIYTTPSQFTIVSAMVKTLLIYNNVLLKIKDRYIYAETALINFTGDDPKIIVENHMDINSLKDEKDFLKEIEDLLKDEKHLKLSSKSLESSLKLGNMNLDGLFQMKRSHKNQLLLLAYKKLSKGSKNEN